MKTILKLALTLMLFCVGCASGSSASKPSQETFLKDLATVLTTRWDEQNSAPEKGTPEYKEYCEKMIKREQDTLNPYRQVTFEDESLRVLANQYLDTLLDQSDALSYYDTDLAIFEDSWNAASNSQFKILSDISDKFEIPLDDEHKQTLYLLKSRLYANENGEPVFNMLNAGEIEEVPDADGNGTTFKYTVLNSMPHDFEDWQLGFFLSYNGSFIDVQMFKTGEWKSGETKTFDIHSPRVSGEYDSFLLYWY